MIIDYATAADYLGKKTDRPLTGRSTRLQRMAEDTIVVRYHSTAVVSYYADRPTMLNSQGWRTVTTKARINEYSPANLCQNKGVWYLVDHVYQGTWKSLYEDCVTIDETGKPTALVDTAAYEKAKRTVDRQVAKYIKGYLADLLEHKAMPTPGNGDCLGCQFKIKGEHPSYPGQGLLGVDHYLSHFTENYYVPSLLLTAMTERKFGDLGIVWSMGNRDLANGQEPYAVRLALRAFFRTRKADLVEHVLGTVA